MIPVQQHLRSPGESLAFSGGCNWSIVGKCVSDLCIPVLSYCCVFYLQIQ